jgi:predicted transcriptional regulator
MEHIITDEFLRNMECQKNLLRKLGKSEEYIAKAEQAIVNAILTMSTVKKMRGN